MLLMIICFACINGQRNNFFDQKDLDYPVGRYPGAPWDKQPFSERMRPNMEPQNNYRPRMPPPDFSNRLHEPRGVGIRLPIHQNLESNRFTEMERMRNKAADARGLGPYGKQLLEDTRAAIGGQQAGLNSYKPKKTGPSPGMGMYWEEEQISTRKPILGRPVPPDEKLLQLAMSRLRNINNVNKETSVAQLSSSVTDLPLEIQEPKSLQMPIKPTRPTKNTSGYPLMDDFGSPIRWVSIFSKDTTDGLARVTDLNTGRNRQYVINGTIFVPVIDYSLERLGLTTTTFRPRAAKKALRTDETALKIVADNIDVNNMDTRDWLAIEVAVRRLKTKEQNCNSEACPARHLSFQCTRLGCESKCRGDSCSSGCVGVSCSTFCKGPSCFAMCIGEDCNAGCEGMACEARCIGNDCQAGCRSFSCKYLVNGDFKEGGETWSEHYPQYDNAPIKQENHY
ncbi:uncharacterized protein LOC123720488 isoform X3 [Pieris brassicae]|uniref:uncharacterized protein LOC123720488 isoform X3 n=1 Tax=Pieris brassicae TaxID=7116 RepID=UPI001E660E19|nr:uncharacterized protein LOC123720488 isoform X3 [Pieris brassicae]